MMCKLTLAFAQTHFYNSHLTPFPLFFISPSTQFNSRRRISWSILFCSHSRSQSSILQNFSCPLFSPDSLQNCLFRSLNKCDCHKFATMPHAFQQAFGVLTSSSNQFYIFCLSFTQITQHSFLLHSIPIPMPPPSCPAPKNLG